MSDTPESVRIFIDELSILSYGHVPHAMRMLERYAELLELERHRNKHRAMLEEQQKARYYASIGKPLPGEQR